MFGVGISLFVVATHQLTIHSKAAMIYDSVVDELYPSTTHPCTIHGKPVMTRLWIVDEP